ncbi:MAG: tubulin-like doman-containing protein, partial [Gemmataceae bacterium]
MSFIREPDAEPIVGYRLIEPLGNGGFGEVWKCEAPGGIYKAIKFVYGNLNSLDSDRAPAEQELNALNAVKEVRHPFVLSMDRIEVVEGELCIVMELADKNLQDCMDECQAAGLVGIPRDDLLRYLRDAAEALDHMIQKHNLQHLDIKPRNLFLISDRVKVADFGLVKHLERQSGSLSSVTPIYAPPETFAGKISEHSDQYSLAIVYQEMLTGQRPFNGKNARQLMMQHTSQDPELRSLPEPERPIIARALAKDPTKRFPNCLSFIRALYNARPKVEALLDEKKVGKSMSETMEDISLEQMEGDVDLAGTPTHGEEEGPVSELGLTLIQPQTGALRPTLIIGMGGFARRCILELRTRMIDRFGDLNKVPLFRFLYIDPDAEACQTLLRGKEDMACTSEEVYHMALQPISNYRRRMMEHVSDWLPHEKLYTLPRSLQTQGVRALGRLAFVDHHLRLLGKVRRAVQHISHPDSLYQAVSQTGLALRDRKPRVYVIMAAGGGSSGTIVDLGYALRRLLQQLKMPNAEVTAVVFCGAPDDPATPKPEQANVYATLTELSHFSDPTIPFTAQYGADGPRIVHEGPPFSYIYLMKLGHRSPEALRDAVAHLGSYLYHELATPLGVKLENSRKPRPAKADITPFRSFGTYQVWFPRGLMLRLAGRQACLTLLRDWQSTEESTAQAEIEAACARAVADPELRYETICGHIEELAAAGFETNLASALTSFLSSLEEQSMQAIAQDDPGNWARQAALRVQEWVGTSMGLTRDSDLQKSKLNRALMGAVNKLADKWSHKLTKVAYGLMEIPGRRIVTSESAIQRLIQFCNDQTALHRERLDQQVQRSRTAESHLEEALDSCMSGGGGFSFFGNRNKRLLRVFMDHLAAYSRQCLAES